MKKVYILLADGFEVIEALAPIDILKRAGVEVVRVAVGNSLDITSSHGHATLHCDTNIAKADLSDGDVLILPGGNPGYINLRTNEDVLNVVRYYFGQNRLIAAICGAPTVLAYAGVAKGANITCHSSVLHEMEGYNRLKESVVKDGNILTSAGAGHSIAFGIEIARCLVDGDTLSRTQQGMEL
ncbi:MAG: DJ-1/PfpI family protein [Alistipes sp.]|nr:DJ-1/PfpI family protein [Alistipes sp.]